MTGGPAAGDRVAFVVGGWRVVVVRPVARRRMRGRRGRQVIQQERAVDPPERLRLVGAASSARQTVRPSRERLHASNRRISTT